MHFKVVLLSMALWMIAAPVHAQTETTLADAVRTAISENPEVQAAWHTFLAAGDQQDVARGGYFPRLDLSAGTGWENWETSDSLDDDFTRSNAALSLRQMIFDGFATRYEVARFGYAKLVRYYEMLAASEDIGLEAVRAYFDVLRYRDLKSMVEENFVQHRIIFNQVQKRVKAGLSRGVDLEQASGRLALAESNLITESTNLHDVSTRYLRIVGHAPSALMTKPELLTEGIPSDRKEALQLAFQENPSFNAAVENVRSAEAQSEASKASFMPRVDFQARQNFGKTSSDFQNREDGTIVELVMSYNLFSGGSNKAERRQSLQQVSTAKNLREKACRDVRQTLSIAFNDKDVLAKQLVYLDEHQISAEKARNAYRDQFNLGQRTLLDLLDTENEYFEARRAYVDRNYDYAFSYARTLNAMGRLLNTLQVSREAIPSLDELGQDRYGIDPESICPAETIETKIEFPPLPDPVATRKVVPPSIAKNNDFDNDGVIDELDACPNTPSGTRVDKFGCPETLPELVHFKVNVQFPTASAKIPDSFAGEIVRLAEFLRKHPDLKLTVEGHTDSVGSSQPNQRLSLERAQSVVRSLVEDHGIQTERLKALGFGEDRPIADNDTFEGRRQNRRVVAMPMDKKR